MKKVNARFRFNTWGILLCFMLFPAITYSQVDDFSDYIVLKNSDTIYCKILQLTDDFIAVNYMKDSNLAFMKTARSNISNWYSKYNIPTKVTTRIRAQTQEKSRILIDEFILKTFYPVVAVQVHSGYGYRAGELPRGLTGSSLKHYQQLTRGFCYGASFSHFGKKGHGIGLHYNNILIQANQLDFEINEPGIYLKGKVKENINIHYLGLSYELLRKSRSKNMWYQQTFGMGWSGFREEITAGQIIKLSGNALSLQYSFSLLFALKNNMNLGIHSLVNAGWVSTFTVFDGLNTTKINPPIKESLYRVQLGVSFNYFIFRKPE